MSIETEINRISTNVSNTLSAVSEMGGEVPEGATSNDMAAGVRSIPVGAKIDDTTPSTSTTYSSSKIESKLTALNEANAALIEVSRTEPSTENTELWIHPNADEVQLPQINDSVESEQDTWSSKKIAAEVSKKANDADLAVVAKSGSYNDLTDKPTISVDGSYLPVNSDNYAADANSVTTTQITKTDRSTLNLPNEITQEKWGVIQFVAENDSAGNGTQMYWPIDSAYAGRMYIRGHNKDGWTKWKRYATTSEIPTVPTTLPNPNKLILSGAVTAEYDGSAPVSVEIPAGGSGGYTLPIASATQLGGVKPAAKTDEMTQAVGVDESGGLWALPGGNQAFRLLGSITLEEDVASVTIPFESPVHEVWFKSTCHAIYTDGTEITSATIKTGVSLGVNGQKVIGGFDIGGKSDRTSLAYIKATTGGVCAISVCNLDSTNARSPQFTSVDNVAESEINSIYVTGPYKNISGTGNIGRIAAGGVITVWGT